MGTIMDAMRFLGPEKCAISVVEGCFEDGTYEILAALNERINAMGGDINPKVGKDVNRVQALAELRNMALLPLTSVTSSGSSANMG
ncbi:unnamed protein product [Penicillium pancosmium]